MVKITKIVIFFYVKNSILFAFSAYIILRAVSSQSAVQEDARGQNSKTMDSNGGYESVKNSTFFIFKNSNQYWY